MPFCSQCGNQVGPSDGFCARCGARQPGAATPAGGPAPLHGIESINGRTASILCYIPWVGWIAAIVVLASDKFRHDRFVRFHAFQGLYLFVAWLIADQVLRPLAGLLFAHIQLYGVVEAGLIGLSIFMMVKAAHEQAYQLPLFGELAHRSMTEE